MKRQRNQRKNCQHLLDHRKKKKTREFQKNIYFCFIDYSKAFDCVDHNKLCKILRDRILDKVICLLRNLYVGQEVTEPDVEQQTQKWFKTGKSMTRLYIVTLFI